MRAEHPGRCARQQAVTSTGSAAEIRGRLHPLVMWFYAIVGVSSFALSLPESSFQISLMDNRLGDWKSSAAINSTAWYCSIIGTGNFSLSNSNPLSHDT